MGPTLRLIGGMLVTFGAVAVGAPEDEKAIPEKKVFPLVREDDQWWTGAADVCEAVGAKFEGDGVVSRVEDENGLRLLLRAQFGGNGPFKVQVGEDTYEFKLDDLAIRKNGEDFGDFLMQPKRIEGTIAATLEDLGRILGFEIGAEIEGQPTITKDAEQYRLVQGEPKEAFRHILKVDDLGNLQLDPEAWKDRLPDQPLIWKYSIQPNQSVVVGGAGGTYTEHNGMLYRRGGAGIGAGPKLGPQGGETLYGPVIPGRYSTEGRSADLMYLSIIKRPAPPDGMVTTPRGRGRVMPKEPD